jgi:opacity protein-like surface antigen
MKKYLLAAALVIVSTSAMADRMISAQSNGWRAALGGGYKTKQDACKDAKGDAQDQASKNNEEVQSYGQCDCENKGSANTPDWSCAVDAKVSKK